MTPLSRRKLETGFHSVEAQQFLLYLEDAQQYQLLMVCTRVCCISLCRIFEIPLFLDEPVFQTCPVVLVKFEAGELLHRSQT